MVEKSTKERYKNNLGKKIDQHCDSVNLVSRVLRWLENLNLFIIYLNVTTLKAIKLILKNN